VALHSAIGAKALRDVAGSHPAALTIWKCERESMEVTRTDVPIYKTIFHTCKGWEIIWDAHSREKLFGYRQAHLPRETCGVLLGYLDTHRQLIYICDLLPAPPDSSGEATGCQRGIEGMEERLQEVARRTLHQVTYIGEWHTHPDGAPCRESEQDQRQMDWIKSKLHPGGRPALMLIGCQDNSVYHYLEVP
jgi:integrative and conjugative element protein (TIGR02256 family)